MNIEIFDNSSSLKIVRDGAVSYISKQRIIELSIISGNVIHLDTGEGHLNDIFIAHADVTNPVTSTVEELRDAIDAMLQVGSMKGIATELKQIEHTAIFKDISGSLGQLNRTIDNMNRRFLGQHLIEDNTVANTVYRGFAPSGSNTSEEVWAILKITNINGIVTFKWAGGVLNYGYIWDNRYSLSYEVTV